MLRGARGTHAGRIGAHSTRRHPGMRREPGAKPTPPSVGAGRRSSVRIRHSSQTRCEAPGGLVILGHPSLESNEATPCKHHRVSKPASRACSISSRYWPGSSLRASSAAGWSSMATPQARRPTSFRTRACSSWVSRSTSSRWRAMSPRLRSSMICSNRSAGASLCWPRSWAWPAAQSRPSAASSTWPLCCCWTEGVM